MTEPVGPAGHGASEPGAAASPSAGAMLRRAREARGLHIAALAASLKVPPKRLESLEQDRWDELPDPAFTRALAQSVCRALKTDPAPVLALLPRADGSRLEQVAGGINAPFRERPGAGEPGMGGLLSQPVVWIVAALLLAAAAVLLWPSRLGTDPVEAEPPAAATETPLPLAAGEAPPAGDAGVPARDAAPGTATGTATGTAPDAPTTPDGGGSADAAASAPPTAGQASSAPASGPAGPLVLIRVAADSWVELREAGGQVLLSRTLRAGEELSLSPALPALLTTGNVDGTEVRLRGEPVDLTAQQRGNIARIELN